MLCKHRLDNSSLSIGTVGSRVVVPVNSGEESFATRDVLPEALNPDLIFMISVDVGAEPHILLVDPNLDLEVSIRDVPLIMKVVKVGGDLHPHRLFMMITTWTLNPV